MKRFFCVLLSCCIASISIPPPSHADIKNMDLNAYIRLMPQRYAMLIRNGGTFFPPERFPDRLTFWMRMIRPTQVTATTPPRITEGLWSSWGLKGYYYSASLVLPDGREVDLLRRVGDTTPQVFTVTPETNYEGQTERFDEPPAPPAGGKFVDIPVTLTFLDTHYFHDYGTGKNYSGRINEDVNCIPMKIRFYNPGQFKVSQAKTIEVTVKVFNFLSFTDDTLNKLTYCDMDRKEAAFGSPLDLINAIKDNILKCRCKRYLLESYYANGENFTDTVYIDANGYTSAQPAAGIKALACYGLMAKSLSSTSIIPATGEDDFHDVIFEELDDIPADGYVNPKYCAYEAGLSLYAMSAFCSEPQISVEGFAEAYDNEVEIIRGKIGNIIKNLRAWQKRPETMGLGANISGRTVVTGNDLANLAATGGWRYYPITEDNLALKGTIAIRDPESAGTWQTADLSVSQWAAIGLYEAIKAKVCDPNGWIPEATDPDVDRAARDIIHDLRYYAAAVQDRATGGAHYSCYNPSLVRRLHAQDGTWWDGVSVSTFTRKTDPRGTNWSEPVYSYIPATDRRQLKITPESVTYSTYYPVYGALVALLNNPLPAGFVSSSYPGGVQSIKLTLEHISDPTDTDILPACTLGSAYNASFHINDISTDPRRIPCNAFAPTADPSSDHWPLNIWSSALGTNSDVFGGGNENYKGSASWPLFSGLSGVTYYRGHNWTYTFPARSAGGIRTPRPCNWSYQDPVLPESTTNNERWIVGTSSLLNIQKLCGITGEPSQKAWDFLIEHYDDTNFVRTQNMEDLSDWDDINHNDLYGMYCNFKGLLMENTTWTEDDGIRDGRDNTFIKNVQIACRDFLFTNMIVDNSRPEIVRAHDSWSKSTGTDVLGTAFMSMMLSEFEPFQKSMYRTVLPAKKPALAFMPRLNDIYFENK